MIYRCQLHDQVYEIQIDGHGNSYRARLDDQEFQVEIVELSQGQIDLRYHGQPIRMYWSRENGRTWISYLGCTYILDKPVYRSRRLQADNSGESLVRAPMPAQVRAMEINEQDLVSKGQTIMLLEAMKMEIRITAPVDGLITRVYVQTDQRVEQGEILFEIKDTSKKD